MVKIDLKIVLSLKTNLYTHIIHPNNSENHLKISGTTPQSSPQSGTPSTNPSTPDTSPIHQAELLPLNLDDLTVRISLR